MKKTMFGVMLGALILSGCNNEEVKTIAQLPKKMISYHQEYSVLENNKFEEEFETFQEAFNYAKTQNAVKIEKTKTKEVLWEKSGQSTILDIPVISQMPELPRGCEVTSLAMMLNDAGVKTDKLTLAKEVKKDTTVYQKKNGEIYFGNPNDGFVGDMYSFSNPGYAVYHGPIKELAEKFLPGKIIDLTGNNFEGVIGFLTAGKPVWVIANARFDYLDDTYWQEWNTPSGKIKITMKEHSVLITGYDQNYVYFNDPLTGQKNRKMLKEKFIKSWEQMGSQAISYID